VAWVREVELSAGTIEYEDSGGDGPALVFLHGVAMAGSGMDAGGRRPGA